MQDGLKRFWFQFDSTDGELPPGFKLGCGVTAFGYEDAISMVRERFSNAFGASLPTILNCIEDVNVSALDENHVIPNMNPPKLRGIWFPRGNENLP